MMAEILYKYCKTWHSEVFWHIFEYNRNNRILTMSSRKGWLEHAFLQIMYKIYIFKEQCRKNILNLAVGTIWQFLVIWLYLWYYHGDWLGISFQQTRDEDSDLEVRNTTWDINPERCGLPWCGTTVMKCNPEWNNYTQLKTKSFF